jgi:ferredoxin
MAFMINEECIACGACVDECPNEAISEADPMYVIDPNLCTECVGFYDEPQCVTVCPVDAIVPNPDYRETQEQLLEKKKRIHGE